MHDRHRFDDDDLAAMQLLVGWGTNVWRRCVGLGLMQTTVLVKMQVLAVVVGVVVVVVAGLKE
jgi:hypothetical protein